MLIHVSRAVRDMPRRYRVEFEPIERVRFVAAGAIAVGLALVAIATISTAAPPVPTVTRKVTFSAVLTPDTAAAWMRAPAGIVQPEWIR